MPVATLRRTRLPDPARRARAHFLEFFPDGFRDETYLETERAYKWDAHRAWQAELGRETLARLVDDGDFGEIAGRAVRIESRTNLLYSFEKMALRDALRSDAGACTFATGLRDWLHGPGGERERFVRWCEAVESLPRRQTRVLTWPVVTVFGFVARPRAHMFVKPNVTRAAADRYGIELTYHSRPNWETYADVLTFARRIRADHADLGPRDMIDAQSFLWVLGSPEYQ